MVATTSLMSSLFLLLLILASSSSSTTTVLASGGEDGGLTHIYLYLHETFEGANATAITSVASPRGANSSFGSVGLLDDEMRVGRDRASELVGRFQGIVVGTDVDGGAFLTSFTFVFTAGEHKGSMLSMQGLVLGLNGTIERPLVGGTGKFKLAHGYSLFKLLGNPTPATVLFEIDLFVLMYHRSKH